MARIRLGLEAPANPSQLECSRLRQIDPDFATVDIQRDGTVRNTPAVEVKAQINSMGEIADRHTFDADRAMTAVGAKADRCGGLAPAKRKTIECLQRIETRLIQDNDVIARSGHGVPHPVTPAQSLGP